MDGHLGRRGGTKSSKLGIHVHAGDKLNHWSAGAVLSAAG